MKLELTKKKSLDLKAQTLQANCDMKKSKLIIETLKVKKEQFKNSDKSMQKPAGLKLRSS